MRRAHSVVGSDGTITFQSDEDGTSDEDGNHRLGFVMGHAENRTDEAEYMREDKCSLTA